MDAQDQIARIEFEGKRELHEIDQRDVPAALFDAADVVAVEAGAFGEAFLREIELDAPRPDAVAKDAHQPIAINSGHVGSVSSVPTIGLHTMSVIRAVDDSCLTFAALHPSLSHPEITIM
jgi:hypothetical protein